MSTVDVEGVPVLNDIIDYRNQIIGCDFWQLFMVYNLKNLVYNTSFVY